MVPGLVSHLDIQWQQTAPSTRTIRCSAAFRDIHAGRSADPVHLPATRQKVRLGIGQPTFPI